MAKAPPASILQAMPLTDANALQKRIQVTGARVEVRPQQSAAGIASAPPA